MVERRIDITDSVRKSFRKHRIKKFYKKVDLGKHDMEIKQKALDEFRK